MPSEQLWPREVVFSIMDTVNSENTIVIYDPVFVLRAILLKRETRHRRSQMDSHWVRKRPGFGRGIQILKYTDLF